MTITDTDLKERKALSQAFNGLLLLSCRFHVRQAWQNNRRRELMGPTALHVELQSWVKRVEDVLIESSGHRG